MFWWPNGQFVFHGVACFPDFSFRRKICSVFENCFSSWWWWLHSLLIFIFASKAQTAPVPDPSACGHFGFLICTSIVGFSWWLPDPIPESGSPRPPRQEVLLLLFEWSIFFYIFIHKKVNTARCGADHPPKVPDDVRPAKRIGFLPTDRRRHPPGSNPTSTGRSVVEQREKHLTL